MSSVFYFFVFYLMGEVKRKGVKRPPTGSKVMSRPPMFALHHGDHYKFNLYIHQMKLSETPRYCPNLNVSDNLTRR